MTEATAVLVGTDPPAQALPPTAKERRLARMGAWLPRGRRLPVAVWERRHRRITAFALLQAAGVAGFALLRGYSLASALVSLTIVGLPALLGAWGIGSRRLRTLSTTVSLMFASATIVDLAGGATEAHFHFFVMVGVVALYQDWAAFIVCLAITVGHHAIFGSIDPEEVYGSESARDSPIVWALIHGGFVFAACVTHLIAWRANEDQELSDPLTRLPNRTAFLEALERRLANPALVTTVMFVDLDNFKTINDSLGHDVGDEALCVAAARIAAAVGPSSLVARMGGDEFAVLADGPAHANEALAGRARAQLRDPATAAGKEVVIQASIGIADNLIADSNEPADLLRDADVAMYLAKASGRNQIVTYTAGVDDAVRAQANLASDLRHALERRELAVHYQPVVEGDDGHLVGAEALLRWQHPVLGNIPPSDFIPVAEQTGEIRTIGAWVLRHAAEQVVAWQRTVPACRHLELAVNVSPVQLRDAGFLAVLEEVLTETGLAPGCLVLEVTESTLLEDLEAVRHQLEVARSRGVRVAIDDFGTGYSSLSYLSRLPVDQLKIDRSFVSKLAPDSARWVLVRAIVEMAAGLGLETLAEGVEEPEQRALLTDLGCQRSQGFLYSRPLAPGDFESYGRASTVAVAP